MDDDFALALSEQVRQNVQALNLLKAAGVATLEAVKALKAMVDVQAKTIKALQEQVQMLESWVGVPQE